VKGWKERMRDREQWRVVVGEATQGYSASGRKEGRKEGTMLRTMENRMIVYIHVSDNYTRCFMGL
jgi:hypothetical protein